PGIIRTGSGCLVFKQPERALEGVLRSLVETGLSIHPPERERFPCFTRRVGACLDQVENPRSESRQRQQVQAVVMQDLYQRRGVAGSTESKVARRNLKPCHVTCSRDRE